MGHFHIDAITWAIFAAHLLVTLALFRLLAARIADTTMGKALGWIVG